MQSASNTKINFLLGIRMCIMCPTPSMWKGVNQARDIILHYSGAKWGFDSSNGRADPAIKSPQRRWNITGDSCSEVANS